MNARAAAERTSTASPSARLEGGVVAVVEADLAREEPVLVELSITGAGDRIHLVEALPGEADAGRAVAAVEAALDRAEDELATTLGVEADVGGLDQGEEVAVPQRHLDDPPLAEQGMIAGGHQGIAGSSPGRQCVQASTVAASCWAFQVHGSSRSSSCALVRPETTRSSTSVSHARGSTPLSFAVATRLATIAHQQAPPSDPANRAFLRPRLIGRIALSTVLVSSSSRPSSRNSTSPCQCRWT